MNKVLVVDDSNVIRNRITRGFNSSQFELVGVAKNGVEAIELFKEKHPQVVTMDLTMPEMDGLACIEELIRLDPEVNILVVSALTDKATGIKAIDLGARGFISKPFTDEQLVDALNELVQEDEE